MLDRQFITAIIITTLAGLSTTIGGAIGFIVKDKNLKFFSFTVGFTGGVMMGISYTGQGSTDHKVSGTL